MNPLYDNDFYTWTQQQAELLRTGQLEKLDSQHLLEELLSMGRSEHRALVSRLSKLLSHLLKWNYQPERQSRSWRLTIIEQRLQTSQLLEDNLGLKSSLDEIMERAYHYAILEAAKETNLPRNQFPASLPWAFDELMQDDWLPD